MAFAVVLLVKMTQQCMSCEVVILLPYSPGVLSAVSYMQEAYV